jgi:hypothetical protein
MDSLTPVELMALAEKVPMTDPHYQLIEAMRQAMDELLTELQG